MNTKSHERRLCVRKTRKFSSPRIFPTLPAHPISTAPALRQEGHAHGNPHPDHPLHRRCTRDAGVPMGQPLMPQIPPRRMMPSPALAYFRTAKKPQRLDVQGIAGFWRRSRDLNPGCDYSHYSLSRGAPSATWVLLHVKLICSWENWRRERDSNPRYLSVSLVFKTSAINRSAISP